MRVICVFYLLSFSASISLFLSFILVSADGANIGGKPNLFLLLIPWKFDVCVLPIPCADEIPKTFADVCVPVIREEGDYRRERVLVLVSYRLDS